MNRLNEVTLENENALKYKSALEKNFQTSINDVSNLVRANEGLAKELENEKVTTEQLKAKLDQVELEKQQLVANVEKEKSITLQLEARL